MKSKLLILILIIPRLQNCQDNRLHSNKNPLSLLRLTAKFIAKNISDYKNQLIEADNKDIIELILEQRNHYELANKINITDNRHIYYPELYVGTKFLTVMHDQQVDIHSTTNRAHIPEILELMPQRPIPRNAQLNHNNHLAYAMLSPDEGHIFYFDTQGKITVHNLSDTKQAAHPIPIKSPIEKTMAMFIPNTQLILIHAAPNQLKIYDYSGNSVQSLSTYFPILKIDVSPNGKIIAAITKFFSSEQITLWNLDNNIPIKSLQITAHVDNLTFSHNSNMLTWSNNNGSYLYDISGNCILSVCASPQTKLHFSKDDQRIVSISRAYLKVVKIINPSSNRIIATFKNIVTVYIWGDKIVTREIGSAVHTVRNDFGVKLFDIHDAESIKIVNDKYLIAQNGHNFKLVRNDGREIQKLYGENNNYEYLIPRSNILISPDGSTIAITNNDDFLTVYKSLEKNDIAALEALEEFVKYKSEKKVTRPTKCKCSCVLL